MNIGFIASNRIESCIRVFIVMVISLLAVDSMSADNGNLEIKTQDGRVTRFLLNKTPRITFTETELIITTKDEQVMLDLADVLEYRVFESGSGIVGEQRDSLIDTILIENGVLKSSAKDINVYSMDGKLILSCRQEPYVPVSIKTLSRGIYIVKAGNTTFKIIIK